MTKVRLPIAAKAINSNIFRKITNGESRPFHSVSHELIRMRRGLTIFRTCRSIVDLHMVFEADIPDIISHPSASQAFHML